MRENEERSHKNSKPQATMLYSANIRQVLCIYGLFNDTVRNSAYTA
jgi:hypothetical protein